MNKFSDSKLLCLPLREAFNLVLDVESYKEFLPHIEDVHIVSKQEDLILADMYVNFNSIKQTYRSEVKHQISNTEASIDVKAIKGIFKHLHNKWHFTEKPNGTMINFDIEFQFASKLLDSIASPIFEMVSKKMIIAFEKRALEKYDKEQNT